ncbi:hypothetical protein ElyMa_003903000 [Elysia marginata]|uniref:Uncharacterized protein n=1 Tax=Elysia marginata TaxID=1093978 RepID=A0AAV4FNF3_9GAST|nr:hypothetical protein ElyMa_003903000 [Elysia marginata]
MFEHSLCLENATSNSHSQRFGLGNHTYKLIMNFQGRVLFEKGRKRRNRPAPDGLSSVVCVCRCCDGVSCQTLRLLGEASDAANDFVIADTPPQDCLMLGLGTRGPISFEDGKKSLVALRL